MCQPPDRVIADQGGNPRTLWFMSGTKPSESPDSRIVAIGAELRELRTAAGLTLREVAKLAGLKSHSRLNLAENGRYLLSESAATKILDALDATPEQRTRILGVSREQGAPGKLTAGVPGIGDALNELVSYERNATRITNYSLGLIPGLLQTSDYAQAIMGDDPQSAFRVALRVGRRDVILRERNPVEMVALIDSDVLVRPIASSSVMTDQLRFLLAMSERPNVTIRLVTPTVHGWHAGLVGPFQLIEFDGPMNPVVHIENHRASLFLWDEDDVAAYQDAAARIAAVAMTPAESAEAIADLINGDPKPCTRGDDEGT